MNELQVIIENREGRLLVSSRVVAEQLGKQHKDVLSKIREVLTERECSLSEYKDNSGKSNPEFLLTKDGFILLCMNYQGYNDFKRAYIAKFNEMEEQLQSPTVVLTDHLELEAKIRIAELIINVKKDRLHHLLHLFSNYFEDRTYPSKDKGAANCDTLGVNEVLALQGENRLSGSQDTSSISKFLDENNVLGMVTNQVYLNYLDFCKAEKLKPTNKINFSRQVIKILDIQIVDKKINGKKCRLFVSK